jgi:hypothetical protein
MRYATCCPCCVQDKADEKVTMISLKYIMVESNIQSRQLTVFFIFQY